MFFTPFDCFFSYGHPFSNYFFKIVKKIVPFGGKRMFFTPFDGFSRNGTLFSLFFKFQNSNRSVPIRGKCLFFTPFDSDRCQVAKFHKLVCDHITIN